jgi:hypothetical protein
MRNVFTNLMAKLERKRQLRDLDVEKLTYFFVLKEGIRYKGDFG